MALERLKSTYGKGAASHDGHNTSSNLAIIDIGSRGVKLEIREAQTLSVKYKTAKTCSLANNLKHTGKLCPDGKEKTFSTLSAFKDIIQAHNIPSGQVRVIGTAQFRNATDGPEFQAEIKEKLGFEVEIISGEQEANYVAQAINNKYPNASGMSADLGGGSLDINVIENGEIVSGASTSLPLGTLIIQSMIEEHGKDYTKAHILEQLADLPEPFQNTDVLFPSGGALRFFNRSFADMHAFKLKNFSEQSVVLASTFNNFSNQIASDPAHQKNRRDLYESRLVLNLLQQHFQFKEHVLLDTNMRDGIFAEMQGQQNKGAPSGGAPMQILTQDKI